MRLLTKYKYMLMSLKMHSKTSRSTSKAFHFSRELIRLITCLTESLHSCDHKVKKENSFSAQL